MCGIAGITDFASARPRTGENILREMSDVITHRGPDSDGLWLSENQKCGFSFRRLSIIDLSPAGNQPMHSSDGRYTIVFNGEIYNHTDIREELIAKGYQYKSGTDTETILNGYAEYGKDIVNRLRGMWAFAIWDNNEQELFCSRDRIGIKPFYYYYNNGLFVFGSEIKSILKHPDVPKELNLDELPNYLNYGISSNYGTLFSGINKLTAGNFLVVNSSGIKQTEYWNPAANSLDPTQFSDKEIQEEIIRMLRAAVKDRMMSDVPFGVFLSGGIDSSLNVALMYELMDRPIDSYSVGFKELEKYNELGYARKVSDLFNTNHREILIDSKDCFEILEELPWYEDEPNADPVCMPLYFLSKLTRDSGTTVIQVGEGSDEQFAGYTWQLRDWNFYNSYWKMFGMMPGFLKKTAYGLTKPFLNTPKGHTALEYLRRASYNEEIYWSGSPVYAPVHLNGLLTKKYHNLIDVPAKHAAALHEEVLGINPRVDYLQRMEYLELRQRLPELLLMRVDKIGMAHSIEARVPFLDHRLVEFTMSISEDKKIPNKKVTKHLLKKAVEGILPDEIIYRKKQGFWAPVNEWFRGDWHDYAKNEIMNSYFIQNKIFNTDYVNGLFNTHKKGKGNLGFRIYALLNLALWHKRFFS